MVTRERPGFPGTPQAVIAIAIIAFGLVKTADNLGWKHADAVLSLWPLALVAVGLVVVSRSDEQSDRISGTLLMVVGGVLAAAPIFGWRIHFWSLWPLVLVAAGVTMIMRARDNRPAIESLDARDQQVSGVAFWAGVKRRVTSTTFKRADLTVVMGGIELDLRGAGVSGGEAVIDLFVLMGGVEIRVPPDWVVSNEVGVVMGGVEDKTQSLPVSPNRLVLRGFVVMGGVELKH